MDAQQAETNVRRFKEAIDALEVAKHAAASVRAGLPEIDTALEAQRAALVDFLEDVAAFGWWHPLHLPALFAVLEVAQGLVGLERGGPVFRLGVKLGDLCKKFAEPVEH